MISIRRTHPCGPCPRKRTPKNTDPPGERNKTKNKTTNLSRTSDPGKQPPGSHTPTHAGMINSLGLARPPSHFGGGTRLDLPACVRVRVAWRGDAPGRRIDGQGLLSCRLCGAMFFGVRFRGRGPHGCVLLIEIYKMFNRT